MFDLFARKVQSIHGLWFKCHCQK